VPEDASAVAGIIGAAVGLGAGVAGYLVGRNSSGTAVEPGALGARGVSPDGNHQFRGFEPQPQQVSRSGRLMNAVDLELLRGGVAVITGGASGIGFALATAAVEHGLCVMMADIQAAAMTASALELQELATASGVEVAGHVTDTSDDESVAGLAAAVAARFPGKPISLIAANAGIGDSGSVFEAPDAHYKRMFGINVFGIANNLRHFVPAAVAQEEPAVVVATASLMGITTGAGTYVAIWPSTRWSR
jgi:hypothetical protein